MEDQTKDVNLLSSEVDVQQYWERNRTFEVSENSTRPKFYCLAMFPYPSGQLHMGHVRNFTLGDVIARFQRLKGKNVLHPIGWDAFGLPAENAAIKRGIAPAKWTRDNIDYMRGQMRRLGFSFDWSRELATCDPEYYRWEQWFFTRMFRKGLVYKKFAWVNWDPVDQTVLANEQVIDGRGWRSDAPVERRELEQWFVKITAYAEELLNCLDQLDGWPEKIKLMQRNWIGRSEGVEMTFPAGTAPAITVYTTRPDTLMGATYVAVAPQHPIALAAAESNPALAAFIEECRHVKVAEADMARLEKRGMATGQSVRHPLTGQPVPVWVANFVLMEYGSGAVMAVPGHDQRDWEFANRYGLPIVQVVRPRDGSTEACDMAVQAYLSKDGVLTNSGEFDGLDFQHAFDAIADALKEKGLGERQVNYRLRDWGVSRQRYWGCPIPIINCRACGAVPVPDVDLPVILPTDVEFDGVGSPLKNIREWYETRCPQCGEEATRETDTFDTFMESSWYYARFESSHHTGGMLDDRSRYWGAVNHYVGGEEHAILHLLYARFFHKMMRDEGLVESDEPFENLLSLGMVLKGGVKMSKSSGDAGDPQFLLDTHGADAVRMAMMFAAPPEQSFEWSEHGVESSARWLRRLWSTVEQHINEGAVATKPIDHHTLPDELKDLRRLAHGTLAKAEDDYGRRLAFNTIVSAVMSLMNQVHKITTTTPESRVVVQEALEIAVLVLSPITPHVSHVLWRDLTGEAIEDAVWPAVDPAALEKTTTTVVVQVNGKVRGRLEVAPGTDQAELESGARALENVEKFLEDKTVRKVVFVRDKLLNFVVS